MMGDNEDGKRRNFLRAPISGSGFGQLGKGFSSTVNSSSSSTTVSTSQTNTLLRPSALTATAEKLRTDKQPSSSLDVSTSWDNNTSIPDSTDTVKHNVFQNKLNESVTDEEVSDLTIPSNGKSFTEKEENPTNSVLPNSAASDKNDFVFGQDISSRVVSAPHASSPVEEAKGVQEFKDITASSDKSDKEDDECITSKSLVESALEYQEKHVKPEFDEVEVFTGEEGESNVLQLIVKAFFFDKDKTKWLERGRGFLHLNDLRQCHGNSPIKSRVIMRVQGSLKVVINTFVFPEMVLEMASDKSVRFSAQMEDGLKMFLLLLNTAADADLFFSAIQARRNQRLSEETSSSSRETYSTVRSPRKRAADKDEIDCPDKVSSCSPKKSRGDIAPSNDDDAVSSSSSSTSTGASSLEHVDKSSKDVLPLS